MVGKIASMQNEVKQITIPNKTDNVLKINVPANSKILCLNCTIEDSSRLISNGYITKESFGYNVLVEQIFVITVNSALTVLHGKDILYSEYKTSGNNKVFNLPKGARVNNVVAKTTGEVLVPSSDNGYLIEY